MSDKESTESKICSFLENIDFKCQCCSDCCRHDPGAVFLTEDDIKKLSTYLKISKNDLLAKYCRGLEMGERTLTSLKERSNYDCVFWNSTCLVYEARPLQCRTYPFWPFLVEDEKRWKEESNRCKGINIKGDLTTEEKFKMYKQEKKAEYFEYSIKVNI